MLLKELLTTTPPMSAESAEGSTPTTDFVVPEAFRETVEEMKVQYPEASEQDLVDMLKLT